MPTRILVLIISKTKFIKITSTIKINKKNVQDSPPHISAIDTTNAYSSSTFDVTAGDVVSENAAPPEIIIENLAEAIDDETTISEENLETPPLPDNSDSSSLIGVGLTNNVLVSDDVDRENVVEIRVHEPSDSNDEVEVELTSLFADDDDDENNHEEVIF